LVDISGEKVNSFLLFISRPYIADINLFDDDEKFKKMRDEKEALCK